MDLLKLEEKEKCISFANNMNAIEGIAVNKETAAEIDSWKYGKKSFLDVLKTVLKRYGFPV